MIHALAVQVAVCRFDSEKETVYANHCISTSSAIRISVCATLHTDIGDGFYQPLCGGAMPALGVQLNDLVFR